MQNFPSDVLNELRKHLEEEKKRTMDRMSQLTAQDPFSDPERSNDNAASDSEASEESSHDRFAAMVDELKARISDIDSALQRISDNTYGYCTNCQKMIDTDRLAILPTAILCLVCEQTKKQVIQVK
jgi:DnaK suppressor protein